MSRGRPKKISKRKNRRHSVQLNEKAEKIYRKVFKNNSHKNFSRYVQEHLIRDFELDTVSYLRRKAAKKNEKIEELRDELEQISDKIQELQGKKTETHRKVDSKV